MDDKKAFATPPGSHSPDSGSESPGACGVSESQFPYKDRCFRKSAAALGDMYETLCPYCTIWTSLPEGAKLEMAHIIDCSLYGYGRRIKNRT